MSSSLSKWSDEALSPDEEIKVQKRLEQRREPMFNKRSMMTLGTTLAITLIIGSVVQTYVKHGIQGNLKSAADDLGDQYSDANTFQRKVPAGFIASFHAMPAMRMAKSVGYQPYYMQRNYNVAQAPMYDMNKAALVSAGAFVTQASLAGNLAEQRQAVNQSYWGAQKETAPMLAQAPGVGGFQQQINYDRKIIRNAQITLKVQNAQKTQSVLEDLVGRHNGTVNSLNLNKLEDGSRAGVMTFSVPPQSLDSVLMEIRKLGEVDSENQSGSDVTNQYSYLQTRITSFESEKERLQKVLKKNADDVGNNLYVQGQISNIEENMIGLQNVLKELDKQSFMATVVVTFYDTVPVVAPKEESLKDRTIATFKNNLKSTLETCYYIAVNSFSGIIIVLSFLFQIGIWALIFWGVYLIVNRFFKK